VTELRFDFLQEGVEFDLILVFEAFQFQHETLPNRPI